MTPSTDFFQRGPIRRTTAAVLLTILAGAALASCSVDSSAARANGAKSERFIQTAHDALPADIQQSGTIKAASSFDYPPFAHLNEASGDYVGVEKDILDSAQEYLGVKINYTNLGKFESLIPAAQSGQEQIVFDGMGIIADRLKAVSFVYYADADVAVLTRKGNPSGIDPAHLCGADLVDAPSGLSAMVYAKESEICVKKGEKPVHITLIPDPASAHAAVLSGQIAGAGTGSATGAYLAAANPKFEVTNPVPGWATANGFILQQSDSGAKLGKALSIAISAMTADGTMQKIFDKHGIKSKVPGKSMYVATPEELDALIASNPNLVRAAG
ncbi:transporter substrate-binding domain-containing protein [bacterium RCC_150]